MADVRPAPLAVTIGESVFALGKRAPALVRPEAMSDNSPVMIARLVELTVVTGERPLPLPPTRFAQIEQTAGSITGVRTAPMVGYARLKPADGLARWLVKHAKAHGWTQPIASAVELDALQGMLAEAQRQPIRQTYALLHRGDVRLRIVLEESATRPEQMTPRATEPLFLVRAELADKPLREAQFTKLFARRKQMTGGTQSVPLSAWAAG